MYSAARAVVLDILPDFDRVSHPGLLHALQFYENLGQTLRKICQNTGSLGPIIFGRIFDCQKWVNSHLLFLESF